MLIRSARPLDANGLPMRLWEKAKVHGVWNPAEIDYAADREQWIRMSPGARAGLRQLFALFHAGERAVTMHLAPLIHASAAEDRVEETIYLSSFQCDEAKHLELFDRCLAEVCGDERDADVDDGDHLAYRAILEDELRDAMNQLLIDRSPAAQVRASATYHLVVEGVLADAGYRLFDLMTKQSRRLPEMERAMTWLHRDESRHIAFGIYFLRRLVAEHGADAYRALLRRMSELKPLTERATRQFVRSLERFGFAYTADELIGWSQEQFDRRMRHICEVRRGR
jgi:ribonucleoside-diphosphate reductase beta chain